MPLEMSYYSSVKMRVCCIAHIISRFREQNIDDMRTGGSNAVLQL
jgi:hypothetical protein